MLRRVLLAALVLCAAVPAAQAAPLAFEPAVYVDQEYPGGEPLLFYDSIHKRTVFSSHEGTTHIYRPGLLASSTGGWVLTYRNQVKIWTSPDGGDTWERSNYMGTGFASDPSKNSGFSDPDLSQDLGGRIYNTGINLATNALFSSGDGGVTWDRGTAQCKSGDRPWVVGGKADEVFFFTNTLEDVLSQRMFRSTDGGDTCSSEGFPEEGIANFGTWPEGGGSWTGNGKPYMDHATETIYAPITSAGGDKLGVSTWTRGDEEFTPHLAADATDMYAHWPAIALDGEGTVYLVWDTDPRAEGTSGGCDGTATPVPNEILMTYSKDRGQTWAAPIRIATPSDRRVFWPWIAAGDAGKVSVVWYETDKVVDLACEDADIFVHAASVMNASDENRRTIEATRAVDRPISHSNICQSGTTCMATGEDRRLGDFFANAVDERGCVMIGTGDTMSPDPITGGDRATSLPLYVKQASGPRLVGEGDCDGSAPPAADPGPQLPGAKACVPRGVRKLRLRGPKGQRLARARVKLNGKRVKVRRRGGKLIARLNLKKVKGARYTVKVVGFTAQGRKVTSRKRYRIC